MNAVHSYGSVGNHVLYTLCIDTANVIINFNKTIVVPKKAINKDKSIDMNTPSFIEDHIAQLPALKLLMNIGWQYLTPDEAFDDCLFMLTQ